MKKVETHAIFFLLAIFIIGCSGTTARTTSGGSSNATLDGRWQMDMSASDDVRARLTPLLQREERYWRRNAERLDEEPRFESQTPVDGDDGISHIQWMRREREKDVETLIAFVAPATELEIRQVDGSIRFASNKGEGTRVFTPGEESTLFLPLGGFEVSSSWEKGSLHVKSRGTGDNKLSITAVFTVKAQVMEERMEVKIPGLKKQSFRFIYRR